MKKKIEPMEFLVTTPSQSEWLDMGDIGQYLFHLAHKINEIIEVLNGEEQTTKLDRCDHERCGHGRLCPCGKDDCTHDNKYTSRAY